MVHEIIGANMVSLTMVSLKQWCQSNYKAVWKKKIRSILYAIHRNKLQMEQSSKYKRLTLYTY